MPHKVRVTLKAALVLLVFLIVFVFVVPLAQSNNHEMAASYIMLAASFMGFLMILEFEQERVLKGFTIIIYGLFVQSWYVPMIFYPHVELISLPADLRHNLEMFSNTILYACSGAGASVIALHADKTSKDNDVQVVNRTVIDNTQGINNLISITKQTSDQIQKLYGMLAIVIMLLVGMAVTVLVMR